MTAVSIVFSAIALLHGVYYLVGVIYRSPFFYLGAMILGVALFVNLLIRVLDEEKTKAIIARELAMSFSKWPFASLYVFMIPMFFRPPYGDAIFWSALIAGYALDASLKTLLRPDRRLRSAIEVLVKWLCAAYVAYWLGVVLNGSFGGFIGGVGS